MPYWKTNTIPAPFEIGPVRDPNTGNPVTTLTKTSFQLVQNGSEVDWDDSTTIAHLAAGVYTVTPVAADANFYGTALARLTQAAMASYDCPPRVFDCVSATAWNLMFTGTGKAPATLNASDVTGYVKSNLYQVLGANCFINGTLTDFTVADAWTTATHYSVGGLCLNPANPTLSIYRCTVEHDSFNNLGEFSYGYYYSSGDVVQYSGNYYLATSNNSDEYPDQSGNWSLIGDNLAAGVAFDSNFQLISYAALSGVLPLGLNSMAGAPLLLTSGDHAYERSVIYSHDTLTGAFVCHPEMTCDAYATFLLLPDRVPQMDATNGNAVAASMADSGASLTAIGDSRVAAIAAKTANIPAAPATEANVTAVGVAVTAIGNALATLAAKFTGITLLATWLRALCRKDTPDETALGEINLGGGTYATATDSLEAQGEKTVLLTSSGAVISAPVLRAGESLPLRRGSAYVTGHTGAITYERPAGEDWTDIAAGFNADPQTVGVALKCGKSDGTLEMTVQASSVTTDLMTFQPIATDTLKLSITTGLWQVDVDWGADDVETLVDGQTNVEPGLA